MNRKCLTGASQRRQRGAASKIRCSLQVACIGLIDDSASAKKLARERRDNCPYRCGACWFPTKNATSWFDNVYNCVHELTS